MLSVAWLNNKHIFLALIFIPIIMMMALISRLIPLALCVLLIIYVIMKDYRIGSFLVIILSFTNIAAQVVIESYHMMLFVLIMTIFSLILSFLKSGLTIKGVREFNLLFLLFGLWCIISGIFAINHQLWFTCIYEMIRAILVFYLLYNSFSKKDVLVIFKVIILSMFLSSFISLAVSMGGFTLSIKTLLSFFSTRFAGTIIDPNYFAMTIAGVFPLAFVIVSRERLLFIKILWLLATLFLIFTVIISQSRTGLLSIAIVFICILIYMIRNKRKEAFLIVIPVILLLIVIPSVFWHRVVTMFNVLSMRGSAGDLSIFHRFQLMAAAFDVFIKNLVFGVGLWNFQVYAGRYTFHPMVAHNTYLEIAADTGLLGLIFFIMILRKGFVVAKKAMVDQQTSELAWAIRIGLLGMLVAMFFLSVPFKMDLWVILALAAVIGTKNDDINTV